MTESDARVVEVDALARFRSALADFGTRTVDRLIEAGTTLAGTGDWLAEREQHWEREVSRWSNAADSLDADLRRCMGSYEPLPCGHISADLAHAEHKLAEARDALDICRSWQTRLADAGDEFRRAKSGMESSIDGPLWSGARMLKHSHDDLRKYLARSAAKSSR